MDWFFRKRRIQILSPLEGYNLWASFYHMESNPVKNLSDNLIEKFLPDLHDKDVLDAGCGTGKFCSLAEKQNARKILGIDLSPNMIKEARSNCKSAEFKCANLFTTPVEEKTFDVIICSLVLGYIEHLTPTLDNLLKALRTEGVLIITDFHPFLTLMQAKRTFRDRHSGQTFEVRDHLHLFHQYFECFFKNDAVFEGFEEPLFNDAPLVFGIPVRKV